MKKFLLLISMFLFIRLYGVAQETPYVIMISFDGFRHDYVERFNLPNFKTFINQGSRAKALIPSFPSKTFPNHYTLATGLYPGHHGLVDNSFYDSDHKEVYTMRIKERVTDSYYYGGTPLWTLVQLHGLKSASYFWVGSEQTEEGKHPAYYYPYDESVPFTARVDQAITWLKMPEQDRPHLIMLYFSSPDHEAHEHGPVAPETKQVLFKMDSLLGDLMKKLKQVTLPVNVVLVSDHGMKELTARQETYIFLRELINTRHPSVKVINGGTQAHIYTQNKAQRDSVYDLLRAKEKNFKVLKREEFPAKWNYNTERSGDLMILAKQGHYIQDKDWSEFMKGVVPGSKFGVHGYDPSKEKDMLGIFYAQGPNIKQGIVIPAFENIHVYPFIALLLQLSVPVIDGRQDVLEKLYVK